MRRLIFIIVLLSCLMTSSVYANTNNVEVINGKLEYNFENNIYTFTGQIKNNYQYHVYYVNINVELVDKDNNKSYTCVNVESISPNTTYNFTSYIYNFVPVNYRIKDINYK